MIGRKNRFHGHGSLRFVYQNGRTVRGPMSSLKFVANPRRSDYRLAVVVSKKVSKSAVTRNRIRRRLYEAFRIREAEFRQPYDMVMTVFHEQMAEIPAGDLQNIVDEQLQQASIIEK